MDYRINLHTIYFVVLIYFMKVTAEPVRLNLTSKTTEQSSNWKTDRYLSSAAIDNCYDRDMGRNCCTHTNGPSGPGWWWVDLGQTSIVNSVKVFNRDSYKERLSQFRVYGSNTSDTNSPDSVECGYRQDTVSDSYNIPCRSPIMASYILIKKGERNSGHLNILTLCEVQIEVCPVNTYGQQCNQCGHCQNPQCDWTSETGDCFGNCTAGYTGSSCDSDCEGDTYGIGCQPCSENCNGTKCYKISESMKCKHGCIAGKTGDNCSLDCEGDTYGIGCQPCSENCNDTKCYKFSESMKCKHGCIAGKTGDNCSLDCEGDTYGIGCQPCSENCNDTKCEKSSETLKCTDGCIAGKTGDNCSLDCPIKTYGKGCLDCPERCINYECQMFSEVVNCTKGCSPGYIGERCEQVCEENTYGQGCQPCSENCRDAKCEKFSDTLICTDECIAGKTGIDCSFDCEGNTYGQGCQPCSENCKDVKCEKFSDTLICTHDCIAGKTGDDCSIVQTDDGETESNTAATAGAVVAVLVILLFVAILGIIYLRRRKQKQSKSDSSLEIGETGIHLHSGLHNNQKDKMCNVENPVIAPKPVCNIGEKNKYQVPENEKSDFVATSTAGDSNVYANVGVEGEPIVSSTQILIKDLDHHLLAMESKNGSFHNEYEDIPKTTSSISVANRPELKYKNRYKNIVPYNNNRVNLNMQNGDPITDYINASFIKDYQGKVSYIAALGSTKITISDTWRMIWEYGITSIFMVTNLTEDEKIKCEQYWPSTGLLTYDDITVIFEEEQTQDPNIVIRKLNVTKDNKEHMVTQYHFVSWPDKQRPLSVTSVLKLRGYLKEERLKATAPILVHCSAGIGRTGTLIALDILLDQMDTEAAVDIKQCVTDLRHQRTQMVQSLVQYKFLYQCIYEIATLGSTAVLVNKFEAFMTSAAFVQRTKNEYQFLERVKPVFSKEETELGKVDYMDKNRDLEVIPSMDHRVKLALFPEIYINAVYVRGYEGPHAFCATQWPLESTAGDFWKIILQEKSAAIVCMEKDIDDSKWFSDRNISVMYDDISISRTCSEEDTEIQVYDVFIQLLESTDIHQQEVEYANVASPQESNVHQLKMIVLKSWSTVDMSQRDLALIPDIYHRVQTIANETKKKHVAVTCRNGASETGLYIGASILFDMIDKEQQVDVVQVVKQIRKTRPQFITSQVKIDSYTALTDLPPPNITDTGTSFEKSGILK